MKNLRCPRALARLSVSLQALSLGGAFVLLPAAALAQAAAAKESPAPTEEVVKLSPFEVKAEEAIGYFQANAISGTRLNSRIEDLGQSITVMTKEQMSDFAMLDVNDVFDYMASTEGTR